AAQLAPRAVAEDVAVLAGGDERLLAACVDAHARRVLALEVRLESFVAPDTEQLEVDAPRAALGIDEREREVAIDAVPDLAALGADDDRLGYHEIAVGAHVDLGAERLDDFVGERRRRKQREERCRANQR